MNQTETGQGCDDSLMPKKSNKKRSVNRGKLRIGDDWNAIRIIALSQSNPLKAVAEFVENSIDAGARKITIVRGRERGDHYLRITDDGQGVSRDEEGKPNFKYVATHICDSIKRQLKEGGAKGLQGEYGIGLLSFWTVGETLWMTSTADDGKAYQMVMHKGKPGYTVEQRRLLVSPEGTEITVKPLLPGLRMLTGEKIQWYLSSELRDRIRNSKSDIQVIDRTSRKQYKVEPRQFEGRLLHQLPEAVCSAGEIYMELYLTEPHSENRVELHRAGTRVMPSLTALDRFHRPPWCEGYLQGLVDASFLQLTPGSRLGVIQDDAYGHFCDAMEPVEAAVQAIVEDLKRAMEERASRNVLRTIKNAFREALLVLPAEEYDWFDVQRPTRGGRSEPDTLSDETDAVSQTNTVSAKQKEFFDHPGPLFSVRVSPTSSVVPVNQSRSLRAVPRDRRRLLVEKNITFSWSVVEGDGRLENEQGEMVTFHAPKEPALVKLKVAVRQDDVTCEAEALVTVTDSLLSDHKPKTSDAKGLPDYSLHHAPGELWRSRFDTEHNVILVNKGHRDYVFASKSKALKLRYLCRLFAKELVLKNFPGLSASELLERMIELSTYTEENLR